MKRIVKRVTTTEEWIDGEPEDRDDAAEQDDESDAEGDETDDDLSVPVRRHAR
jgi:hypothetical protein